MPEKEYQRLCRARPRSGFAVAISFRSSLWLGKDHLLCIETTGYTETYKRFYFRDIQAITTHQSKRRLVWNIILGSLFGLFALLTQGVLSSGESEGAIVLGIFAGFFLLFLLINIFKGPTTVCHLRTAVQTEELAPLRRLRRAHKVLDRLRPLIIAAQGQIPPAELQQLMHQLTIHGSAAAMPAYQATPSVDPDPTANPEPRPEP